MRFYAKKSLGQHFLNSPRILRKIIDTGMIRKGETVLEIGPGTGILTQALLTAGAKVIAVEKDVRAIEMLRQTFSKECAAGDLVVKEGDVLKMSFGGSVSGGASDDSEPRLAEGNFALIANIPYYITGAILEKFLEHGPRPNRMVLLVQKEVAERIVARDGKESILSVSVKAFGTPKVVATVPSGAFTPPPSVDSAILAIENISGKRFAAGDKMTTRLDPASFFTFVKAGFAHKRKLAMRNLEEVILRENIEKVWREVGLDPKVRAEDITEEQWVKIAVCASNISE